MNDIFIARSGSIFVLGISLGTSIEYAKRHLKEKYLVKENNNCIYTTCNLFNIYRGIDLSFLKDDNHRVKSIRIVYHNTYINTENLYKRLRRCFSSLNEFQDEVRKQEKECVLCNLLHKVNIIRHKEPTYAVLLVSIDSDILNTENYDELKTEVCKLYIGRHNNEDAFPCVRNIPLKKVIIAAFILIGMAIVFLYALNDRYIRVNSDVIYDKWTQKATYVIPQ